MKKVGKYISEIREKIGFDKLEKREKLIVSFGIGFLFFFIILQFGVSPYFDARKKQQNAIVKKQLELAELKSLQVEYRDLKRQAGGIKEKLKGRQASFSLFSFIEKQATSSDIKDLISYMKPSTVEGSEDLQQSVVEMKLQKISLQQLVDFLKRIESPENVVSVKRISIQESGKEKGFMEVILQIITFVSKG